MKSALRKISAFFLLLTGAMPLFFTFLFLIKQQVIRHEMKEKLEEQMLQTIIVPKEEVQWIKYNKEISVDDKLFDIRTYSEKNGSFVFHGLFDSEETALNELIEKDTDEKNKNGLVQLFYLLQSPCLNITVDPGIIKVNEKIASLPILLNISSPFINILTPPPQDMMI